MFLLWTGLKKFQIFMSEFFTNQTEDRGIASIYGN